MEYYELNVLYVNTSESGPSYELKAELAS